MRCALLSTWVALLIGASAASAEECGPLDGAQFICGVDNVEDFAQLPNGQLIGSDLAMPGKQGHFFLFKPDRSVRTIKSEEIAIEPDPAYAECPGAPDWEQFGPHGLGVSFSAGKGMLYAINHGGREAVEIFELDLAGKEPKFSWKGCLVAPKNEWPDDVAALPDGGLVVTSLWNPNDQERVEKLANGKPVGALYEWHHGKGWTLIPGSESLSGPNGVIATDDGKKLYVAAWSGKQIVEVDRTSSKFTAFDVDFIPDNLNWSTDKSTILATGIAGTISDALKCFGSSDTNCPQTGIRIDRFDPQKMTSEAIVPSRTLGKFGAATGAVEVGKEIWVNSFRSDRIAILSIQ